MGIHFLRGRQLSIFLIILFSLLCLNEAFRWDINCTDGCKDSFTVVGSIPDVALLDRGVSQAMFGQRGGTVEVNLEITAKNAADVDYLFFLLLDEEQTRIPDVQYYTVYGDPDVALYNVKAGIRYPLSVGFNRMSFDIPYGAYYFPILINPFERDYHFKGYVSMTNKDESHFPLTWEGLNNSRFFALGYGSLAILSVFLLLRPYSRMEDGRTSLSGPQKAQRRLAVSLFGLSVMKMVHMAVLGLVISDCESNKGVLSRFIPSFGMFLGSFAEIFMLYTIFMAISSARHNASTAAISEIRVGTGLLIAGLILSIIGSLDIRVFISRAFFGVFGQILIFCGFTLCIVVSSLSNRDQIRNALMTKNMSHTTPRLYARQRHINALQSAFFIYAFGVVMGFTLTVDSLKTNMPVLYVLKFSIEFAFTLYLYFTYFQLDTPAFFKYAFKVPPKRNRDNANDNINGAQE